MAGRIVKPQELKDGGDQSQAASGGDYCRPIATKRRTGSNLAADCGNVGQRLVEIAHLMPQLYIAKYTRTQSKCKPAGSRPRVSRAGSCNGNSGRQKNYTAISIIYEFEFLF